MQTQLNFHRYHFLSSVDVYNADNPYGWTRVITCAWSELCSTINLQHSINIFKKIKTKPLCNGTMGCLKCKFKVLISAHTEQHAVWGFDHLLNK